MSDSGRGGQVRGPPTPTRTSHPCELDHAPISSTAPRAGGMVDLLRSPTKPGNLRQGRRLIWPASRRAQKGGEWMRRGRRSGEEEDEEGGGRGRRAPGRGAAPWRGPPRESLPCGLPALPLALPLASHPFQEEDQIPSSPRDHQRGGARRRIGSCHHHQGRRAPGRRRGAPPGGPLPCRGSWTRPSRSSRQRRRPAWEGPWP